MFSGVNLVRIHECLCHRTRLRIVHLLLRGPLCVCHLQDVIGEPQAKVSRHLAYLRRHGMVKTERRGKWVLYRLTENRPPLLEANLACLQDCAGEEAVFRRDLRKLGGLGNTNLPFSGSCAAVDRRSVTPV
jgi:ArsR family transcriptional regulator